MLTKVTFVLIAILVVCANRLCQFKCFLVGYAGRGTKHCTLVNASVGGQCPPYFVFGVCFVLNILGQPVIQADPKFQLSDSYFTTVTVTVAVAVAP